MSMCLLLPNFRPSSKTDPLGVILSIRSLPLITTTPEEENRLFRPHLSLFRPFLRTSPYWLTRYRPRLSPEALRMLHTSTEDQYRLGVRDPRPTRGGKTAKTDTAKGGFLKFNTQNKASSSCILLLQWSTTSQMLWVYRISVPYYAQKDPRFLFEKRRGQPREFWSLVSTIDGSTLPQDCVEEQLC